MTKITRKKIKMEDRKWQCNIQIIYFQKRSGQNRSNNKKKELNAFPN